MGEKKLKENTFGRTNHDDMVVLERGGGEGPDLDLGFCFHDFL